MPSIKVKVGRCSLAEDIIRVNHISQHLNDDQRLRLDANQSWTFEQAKQFLSAVPNNVIEYIEEPLNDPEGYQRWASVIKIPFALDEQVQLANFTLRPQQGLSTIVLKPMLVGLSRTRLLAEQANSMGVNVVISSSYESSLTLNFLYELARELPSSLPPGLDTFSQFDVDLIEPLMLPVAGRDVPLISLGHSLGKNYLKKVGCYNA